MNAQKFKLIPVLGALLGLQLLLALVLSLAGSDADFQDEQSTLIPADLAAVDRIRIEDGIDNGVTLQKSDQEWQVAEVFSFPTDNEQMEKLLQSLSGLRLSWPVGTSREAAQRFKVASDAFERKVVLYRQDEAVAELLIGTTAAFRKSHVRLADSDEIHVGDLNTYEVYARPEEWIDKNILRHDPAEITSIRLPGMSLQRGEEGLVVNDLKNNQQTNADQAEALLGKIANLRIQEVLGTEAKPVYGQNKPTHTIGLTRNDGATIDYTISQPQDKSYYVLKSSARPEYFKIPTYTLDPIFNTKRDQLVEAKQPEAGENRAS
jgi:hypothetical protein